MAKFKWNVLADWLVVIGAVNWGLAAFGFNIVDMLLGGFATWAYYAVGAAGIYKLFKLFK